MKPNLLLQFILARLADVTIGQLMQMFGVDLAAVGGDPKRLVEAAQGQLLSDAAAAPDPPKVQFLPLESIYLFKQTTGTFFDPTERFRKEWAHTGDLVESPEWEVDEEMGAITYARTFRGLDAANQPIFRSLTLPIKEAQRTNAPQPNSGTVDNRPYRPFPCRALHWWEQIEPTQFSPGYRIRNTAYKPLDEEKREFTVGDHRRLLELYDAHIEAQGRNTVPTAEAADSRGDG